MRKLPFETMMKPLQELVRPNVWKLAAAKEADGEPSGQDIHVFLDANENPYNRPLNRYSDPLQHELKAELSRIKNVSEEHIFIGNGTIEAIDLAYRVFCRPQNDNVVAIEPTRGVYKACADMNDVEYRPVLLGKHFQLSADRLLAACDRHTKIIWLCSPNDPTGNNLDGKEIEAVLNRFDGIVVVDEAYSDFSTAQIFRNRIDEFPNIIVLNTMSNAWGCAALGLGMAFASCDIIRIFNRVKYPHNINKPTQELALEALRNRTEVEKWANILLPERGRLMAAFADLPFCEEVFPADSNFFLARMTDAKAVYDYLIGCGIRVSNKSNVALCHDCLRITIGTKGENTALLSALRQY